MIAAPILEDVFSRIGERHRLPPAPPGTLIATTVELPQAMRHIRGEQQQQIFAERLEIVYPPDRSRLEIRTGESISIKVRRGTPPLRLLVDGKPIESEPWRSDIVWHPIGRGIFDILVIDAKGAAARSNIVLN